MLPIDGALFQVMLPVPVSIQFGFVTVLSTDLDVAARIRHEQPELDRLDGAGQPGDVEPDDSSDRWCSPGPGPLAFAGWSAPPKLLFAEELFLT